MSFVGRQQEEVAALEGPWPWDRCWQVDNETQGTFPAWESTACERLQGKAKDIKAGCREGEVPHVRGKKQFCLMWWARHRSWDRITHPGEQGWEWIWDNIIVWGSWITGFSKSVNGSYIRRSETTQGLDLGTDSGILFQCFIELAGMFLTAVKPRLCFDFDKQPWRRV